MDRLDDDLLPEQSTRDPVPAAEARDPERRAAVVWWSRLDDRYQVEVVRAPGSEVDAELRVFDDDDRHRALLREPVTLAFGAKYGPDVADVAAWQRRVIRLVDREPDSS